MQISWSSDGTQVAGATGSGQILLGQVVDRCDAINMTCNGPLGWIMHLILYIKNMVLNYHVHVHVYNIV